METEPTLEGIVIRDIVYTTEQGPPTPEGLPQPEKHIREEERIPTGSFQLGEIGYTVNKLIADGAYGKVYKATQLSNNREVALKISSEVDPDKSDLAFREARITANLSHPNIVKIIELAAAETEPGLAPVLVMELVTGEKMSDRSYDLSTLIDIGGKVADALDYAHSKGIIHGDVKPANIIMEEDTGEPVLTDWGSAGGGYREDDQTQQHMYGTAQYVAPEQLQTKTPVSEQVDQHALAASLFRNLTMLYKIFEEDGVFSIDPSHSSPKQTLTKPDGLPEEIYEVFNKAMAYSPEERYESCTEFTNALRDVVHQHPEYANLGERDITSTTQHPDIKARLVSNEPS